VQWEILDEHSQARISCELREVSQLGQSMAVDTPWCSKDLSCISLLNLQKQSLLKELCVCGTGISSQSCVLAKHGLYHLSRPSSPWWNFCEVWTLSVLLTAEFHKWLARDERTLKDVYYCNQKRKFKNVEVKQLSRGQGQGQGQSGVEPRLRREVACKAPYFWSPCCIFLVLLASFFPFLWSA
jgi:hypothetical protein